MKRRFIYILIIAVLVNFITFHLSGQLSQGGRPVLLKGNVLQNIPVVDLPSPAFEQLLAVREDDNQGRLKHLYFADNYSILANPVSSGRWTTEEDGTRIWILEIRSEGAYSIGLIISRFHLKGESRLFVYNEDRSHVLGAFTKENNNAADILPVSHIPGERIYIQMELPPGQSDYGTLMIEEAAVAYLPVFADDPYKDGRFGMSDECNVDINCPEGDNWQDLKRSVCRILINSNKWCSGTLINTAINSKEPYILTAAHCIGSQGEANRSVFYFYYESPSCDGPDGVTDHQISGATLVATGDSLGESMNRDSLDFSLVRLNVQLPVNFRVYYAG